MTKIERKIARKIAVISSNRADAGLLTGLMHSINQHSDLKLLLFVSSMHLSDHDHDFWQEFTAQKLNITEKIPLLINGNQPLDNAIALGKAVQQFAKVLQHYQPDILVILGDRFEIFAAASAAMMLQIPVAHLHGGELTLGAIDDAIRHAISKMAQIHFTATEQYRQRLLQMGEQPDRVFNVGATSTDILLDMNYLNRQALEKILNIKIKHAFFLITWHPETLQAAHTDSDDPLKGLKELIKALQQFPDYQIIFTKANCDSGGQAINRYLEKLSEQHADYYLFSSLGIQNYTSLVKLSHAVIGNSSSALLEVASLRKPAVNIGHRQDGRYKPESVINCEADSKSITQAINRALSDAHRQTCKNMSLPYGEGNTNQKITQVLAEIELNNIMYKPFYNPGADCS